MRAVSASERTHRCVCARGPALVRSRWVTRGGFENYIDRVLARIFWLTCWALTLLIAGVFAAWALGGLLNLAR
jgi:hypothetical protein